MPSINKFPLLAIIGAAAGAIVIGITLYYSFMPAWVSVEVSGEASYDENGNLVVVRGGFVDRDLASRNIITLSDSELERYSVLQRQIERADEIYPSVPTGFDKLPSQSEARAIVELLNLDKEQERDDRGQFIYNDRVYYIHVTYGYQQPASA